MRAKLEFRRQQCADCYLQTSGARVIKFQADRGLFKFCRMRPDFVTVLCSAHFRSSSKLYDNMTCAPWSSTKFGLLYSVPKGVRRGREHVGKQTNWAHGALAESEEEALMF